MSDQPWGTPPPPPPPPPPPAVPPSAMPQQYAGGPVPAAGYAPAVAAPLPYAQPMPPQLQYAAAGLFPYESARPRANVVIGLTWAAIACQALMIWPSWVSITQARLVAAGADPSDELTVADWMQVGLGLTQVVVMILAIVFWMMWIHRAYRNLPPLGAEGLNYSPGWAVGYYFIPILNLFRPYQVMKETWKASDPRHAGGTSWQLIAVSSLIGWWWAFHIVSAVVNQMSLRAAIQVGDPQVTLTFAQVDFAMLFFDGILMLMEIWLVRTVTSLQEQRAGAVGTAAPAVGWRPGGSI